MKHSGLIRKRANHHKQSRQQPKKTAKPTTRKSPGRFAFRHRETTAKQNKERGQGPNKTPKPETTDLPIDTGGMSHRVIKDMHYETIRLSSMCENTRAAWQLFFTAWTWAKPHRFDSSVTLLLRRVLQSKTQWHSNVLKLLKLLQKSSQASKTFFQLLQIKRLQLKLTNNLQNSYQISSQHQVPKTWVKQHPKTPKTTKTNENPSPSAQTGSIWFQMVPTWFL